ncbi:unnamed protein product [Onchocerca flexuosa]|uniref:Homeobox protein 2-like n=1 Tax=Onchocerca flexuosa TaxID=387005 RepID=A0A183HH10_9BILA|nr:unnamed protein product [Onchocerca flexuosa]
MEICHYNDNSGHYDQYKRISEVLLDEMAQQSSITIPTTNINTTVATLTTTTISNQSKHPLKRSESRLNPEKSRSINIINNNDLYHYNDNNYKDLYHFYDPIYDPNDQYLPVKKYFSVDHFNPLIFETSQQRNEKNWSNHYRKQNFMNESFENCKLIPTEIQPISSQNFYSLDLLPGNSKKLKTNHSFECLLHHKNIPFYIWGSMSQQKKDDESYHSGRRKCFATMTDTCSCFNHSNYENDSDDDDNDNDNDDDDVNDEDDDGDVVVETDSILSEGRHYNKSKISWYNESENLKNNDSKHERITTRYEESRFDRAKFMASAAEKLLTADRNMREAQRNSILHPRIGRTRSLFNLFFPRKLLALEISNPVLISSTRSTEYLRYLPDVQSVDNGLNDVRIFVEIRN